MFLGGGFGVVKFEVFVGLLFHFFLGGGEGFRLAIHFRGFGLGGLDGRAF